MRIFWCFLIEFVVFGGGAVQSAPQIIQSIPQTTFQSDQDSTEHASHSAAHDVFVKNCIRHNKCSDAIAFLQNLKTPKSHMQLGFMALNGVCGHVNKPRANFYFLKAAHQNNGQAYKALGDSFYTGDGIEKCAQLALDYYKKSQKLGYAPGAINAAIIYKNRYLKNRKFKDKIRAQYYAKLFLKMNADKDMDVLAHNIISSVQNPKFKKNTKS